MKSGIFAVAHIGQLRLYVGEVQHLRTRWPIMMGQLAAGTYPDSRIQQSWNSVEGERRFTFHTAQEIKQDSQILGRAQFFTDVE
ncbi:MAG: hypothetical protein F6J97_22875 [Leptolyngbya sp. SIO4C1]|nr:hypothetical protein [Leptolyngbya sp. SIO4C1]